MRLTSDLLIPLSAPNVRTKSSTLRVETPHAAWGSATPDPQAVVFSTVGRWPLRWASRSGVRWCRGGADHAGELGPDEGLVDGLGGLADAVVDLCGLECVQDLQQCSLSSATVRVSFREHHWPGLADHRTVATLLCTATPSRSCSYTTPRDATFPVAYAAGSQVQSGDLGYVDTPASRPESRVTRTWPTMHSP
jgi:hypothetical protein